jgi:hypothetical protein
LIQLETPKAVLPFDFAQGRTALGVSTFSTSTYYWSFDYFLYNAAQPSLRERCAAYLILAPIFPETLTASAFQGKSAQFSQKSSY